MGITTSSDEFAASEASDDAPEAEKGAFDSFHRPASEVRARRLDERVVLGSGTEAVVGQPGDWLVKEADGTRRIHDDETFRETYRGATVAANKALDESASE